MLNRLAYSLRETLANLTRNFTLTLASILTVVVSLTLVGVAVLARQGVDNQPSSGRAASSSSSS